MNLAFPARWTIHATMLGVLAGCASPPMSLPGPITYSRTPRGDGGVLVESTPGTPTATSTVITPMPTAPIGGPRAAAPAPRAAPPAGADDEPVSMALEQTPLPLFIQILYGNVLKRPYSMDAAINARTDLVTFKTTTPIARARMAQLGVTLLRSYGLAVQDLDGLVRIVPDTAPSAAPPPVLRRGRVLPETPEALRPAFQHVELDVVRSTDVSQWLRQILGTRVNVQEDSARNGFLLAGTQSDLRTALDLIAVLDQPRMRGNVARRISPANMAANEFASRLVEVMTAQGYSISTGGTGSTPILLVPIPAINAVMAFANSDAVMDHLLRWAAEIDRPVAVKSQSGLYTYPVKYADAQELARTLGEILSGTPSPSPAPQGGSQLPGASAAPAAAAAPRPAGSRVVVNSATNTLIFRGTSADEYQQIMALMRELDRPVKSAMIEVVVAELSLGGTQTLGIDWRIPARQINGDNNLIAAGTLGGIGVGSGGFNISLGNSAGALLARLNALAQNDNARILSNPKVLARNGETASIQVGQEVPIITSQQSTGTTSTGLFGSTTGVLQQISYRSTGVILRVRPVINSGNRLDLDLSQEVSSAQQTSTGVGASPTISTRRIETKLSLRDGSTILLGGLISRNQSDSNVGVPFLKDLPFIGSAFRSETGSKNQTELLIMITPYVVSDDFESESISEAIQNSFGDWAKDIKRARVVPQPEVIAVPPPRPREPAAPVPEALPPAAPGAAVRPPMPSGAPTPAAGPVPPSPAPAAPSTGAPPPAAPASDKSTDGVSMSRPEAARPPDASASAPKAAATPASGAKPAPPGNLPPGSREVTDPKVKEEILKLLEKKR